MQIGIANGIPLNDVITGDDLVPAYDQSTGTEGYVNLTTAVQKAFSGSVAGTANGVLYLNGSKVATSGSALTFDGAKLSVSGSTAGSGVIKFGDPGDTNPYVGIYRSAASSINTNGNFLNLGGYDGIAFTAGNSVLASQPEQMRLTSTGLGIGTSSPEQKLHVASSANYAAIKFTNSAASKGIISYSSDDLIFYTNNAERLRIDSAGNLGLGVTPSAWSSLHKAFQIGTNGALYQNTNFGTTFLSTNSYVNAAGNDIYLYTGSASRYVQTNNGSHYWFTAPSGTAGDAISFTQAMTLDANGNLLVGTTTIDGNIGASSGGCTYTFRTTDGLRVAQNGASYWNKFDAGILLQWRHAGVDCGNIYVSTNNTAYNTSSDYRLKNITGPLQNSGVYIDSLNPVEGTWKADGSTFVGLIAHEVQEVSRTQVATGEKDGAEMQAMDYSNSELIANLIAEVKSLRARVAALEA